MSITKIELGSLSAEKDDRFANHFIETKFLSKIKTGNSDIIYGAKGVGKTALRRALTEINNETFFSTIVIDLSLLSFQNIHYKLAQLNTATQTEIPLLARSTWKNILINYAMLAFSNNLDEQNPLKNKISSLLTNEGFIISNELDNYKEDTNRKMLNMVERFFSAIVELGVEDSVTPTGLNPRQRNVVNKFPLNNDIKDVLFESSRFIANAKKKILVCLDGFDSIVDHTPESRRAILAGLIDAIFQLENEKLISSAYCFKAFLPQELTIDANTIIWDIDKNRRNLHYIRWSTNDFKLFIGKRLETYSKKKSLKFDDIWLEFMPEKIMNPVHSVEENTFEYILRHTLYRPRQVLDHIQTIFDDWFNQNYASEKIDPSFIPPIIAESNIVMADHVASQLSLIHPQIKKFLKSWRDTQNIIEVGEVKKRIKKHFHNIENDEVDKIFDELFTFGVFGIYSKNDNINQTSSRVYFKYAFVGDSIGSYIHTAIADGDLLAFSPMFREYCGCSPSQKGVTIPIALDNL